jgi:hypothetical protein
MPRLMRTALHAIASLFSAFLISAASPARAQAYRVIIVGQTNASVVTGLGCAFGEYVGSDNFENTPRAIMWSGSFSKAIVLHPAWSGESVALGISDGQQVGYFMTSRGPHAALWYGTAESMVDLHPGEFATSSALGVWGGVQVGSGSYGDLDRALLWTGSAVSVVNLHPTNRPGQIDPFNSTTASCVAGPFQGGHGWLHYYEPHALRWRGTRTSWIDLHPLIPARLYSGSYVSAISCDGTAVGVGLIPIAGFPQPPPTTSHALVWYGSATNYVDLHPQGFAYSQATGISGSKQVGFGGRTNEPPHALVWSGAPDSVIDLHAFLTPGFSSSQALAIDEFGNVFGIANPVGDSTRPAVLWVPDDRETNNPSLKIASLCATGGKVRIQMLCDTGHEYVIEASEDLLNWEPILRTNTVSPLVYVRNVEAANHQSEFFRVMRPGAFNSHSSRGGQ